MWEFRTSEHHVSRHRNLGEVQVGDVEASPCHHQPIRARDRPSRAARRSVAFRCPQTEPIDPGTLRQQPRRQPDPDRRQCRLQPTQERQRPSPLAYRCQYVEDWIAVKTRRSLTVDNAERTALEETIEACERRLIEVRTAGVVFADGTRIADPTGDRPRRHGRAATVNHASASRGRCRCWRGRACGALETSMVEATTERATAS